MISGTTTPISSAWVWIYDSSGALLARVVTDFTGRYFIGGLSAGTYYVKAGGAGYLSQQVQRRELPLVFADVRDPGRAVGQRQRRRN